MLFFLVRPAGLSTAPAINAAKAIALVIAALGYKGVFAREPEAELLVLPEGAKKGNDASGAALTFKVELVIDDGTAATADHIYFVNAHNAKIEWHYDNLQRATGNSQHSGTVNISTEFDSAAGAFVMRDPSRSDNRLVLNHLDPVLRNKPGIITTDVFGNSDPHGPPGTLFTDADYLWGDGTNSNRQTAGVDAHFGAMLTYDYYLNQHGIRSLDGNNFQMCSRTHFRGNQDDARYSLISKCTMYGNGTLGRNSAAVDIVGHEFTHGVTQFAVPPD